MPADFILIVKNGQFEMTRDFDEANCYLCGKAARGPLDSTGISSNVTSS
jgi:hypothetical protein